MNLFVGQPGSLSNDFHRDPQLKQCTCRFLSSFFSAFLPTFLQPFVAGVDDLVLYVSCGGHIQLVFGAFVGRKVIQFRGIKQQSEDFLLEFGGALGEVLHLMEGKADVVQDGGLRGQCAGKGVGEFEEDVLDAGGHEFAETVLAEGVAEVDLVGTLVHGEVHEADEIDGREVIVGFSSSFLLLDGERGVVDGALVEVVLRGDLHLADEAGAVAVVAFDIDPDVLVVVEKVDVLDVVGADFDDVMLWDDLLEEQVQKTEAVLLHEEGAFEPAVHDDPRIASHDGLLGIVHRYKENCGPAEGNGRS